MAFVKLAGPAKIGGKWRRAEETVEVGEDALAGLDDLGLVAETLTDLQAAPQMDVRNVDMASLPAGGKLITVTEEQFHLAVAAQAEALAGAATDAVIEGLENQTRRVEELQTELAAERIAHDETRALLAEIQNARAEIPAHEAPAEDGPETAEAGETPAPTDTPPSEPPAKTAPKKKGAAGITKG